MKRFLSSASQIEVLGTYVEKKQAQNSLGNAITNKYSCMDVNELRRNAGKTDGEAEHHNSGLGYN